jgi:type IV secretion system protein TrbL
MRSEQRARHHRHALLEVARAGARGGATAAPDLSEKD